MNGGHMDSVSLTNASKSLIKDDREPLDAMSTTTTTSSSSAAAPESRTVNNFNHHDISGSEHHLPAGSPKTQVGIPLNTARRTRTRRIRTIFSMEGPTNFHTLRLGIKALLISSLLILSHLLLTTSGSRQATDASESLDIAGYTTSLKYTSATIHHTLLWIAFTLLEAVDLGRMSRADEEACGWIFGNTASEVGLNTIVLLAWIYDASHAVSVMRLLTFNSLSENGMLPLSYFVAFLWIALLQLQLILSIAYHAILNGSKSLLDTSFWKNRTGHWTERIELDLESDGDLPSDVMPFTSPDSDSAKSVATPPPYGGSYGHGQPEEVIGLPVYVDEKV